MVAHWTPQRRVLVLVGAIVVLDAVFFAALTPMLPYYADRFELSDTASGILSGGYAAGTLAGSLPSGWLGSRIGPRKTVVVGLVVMSMSSLVFAFGNDVVLLDAARFVQGLAGACSWVGAMGWLLSVTPVSERGRAIGLIMGLAFSGALLGPVFGAVAREVGPELPFTVVAGLSMVLLAGTRRTPKPRPSVGATSSLVAALRDSAVRLGMWLMVLPAFVSGSLNVLNPLRLDHLGAGGAAIGGTFLIAAAVQAVGQIFIGRLSDRIGRRIPLLAVLCAGAILLVLLPRSNAVALFTCLVIIATACFGVMYTPATALLTDGAEAVGLRQTLGLALVNLTWAGGQSIGALSAGGVADATPDAAPYLLLAGISAVAVGALLPRERARAFDRGSESDARGDEVPERSGAASVCR